MIRVVEKKEIDQDAWDDLVSKSSFSSWFQTKEAYGFFDSLSFLEAFAFGVEREGVLKGVIVGYVQKDGNRIKQYLSRRAVIHGGPLLSNDISDQELVMMLTSVKAWLKKKVIYVETRNYNDYSRWKLVFEKSGFAYEPHLNFHLDCSNMQVVENNIGKHRRRYIRLSLKNGATIVDNPSESQMLEFYSLLSELYKTKVKTTLFPRDFFARLFALESCRFVLVQYDDIIIGGSVCVCTSKTMYEWFACGKDGLYRNVYPSSLTKYAGIKLANEMGCFVFDMMGAGKPNEEYGVRDFKAEFGGKLVEHGRFVCVMDKLLYRLGKVGVAVLKKL